MFDTEHEKPNSSSTSTEYGPDQEILDAEWYARYEQLDDILSKPIYGLLVAPKEQRIQERDEFFAALDQGAAPKNPDLSINVDLDMLDNAEQQYLELKRDVKASETNEAVRNAYLWRINEKIANIRMARAAAQGDSRRYQAYNYYIYGEPDPKIFAGTVNFFNGMAQYSAQDFDHPVVAAAAQRLIDVLATINAGETTALNPDAETFRDQKDRHASIYEMILQGTDIPEELNSDQAVDNMDIVLANIGAKAAGYHAVKDRSGATVMSVSHKHTLVIIPEEETWDATRFTGLIGHEIYGHVGDKLRAGALPLRLLRKGLDRTEPTNEGKGVFREQVVYPTIEDFIKTKRHQDILRRHLSASLAYGHGGEPRDFADVFKIMNALDEYLEANQAGNLNSENHKTARNRTWNLLASRTLKGGSRAGDTYLKDKVYLEGNIRQWQLAQDHPELDEYWDTIGIADLSNPRHIWILQQLGILPYNEDID